MCFQWYHRVVAFQKSDSSSEAFESERRAQIKNEEAFQSDSSESERRAQIEIQIGYNNLKKKPWIQIRKNRNTL